MNVFIEVYVCVILLIMITVIIFYGLPYYNMNVYILTHRHMAVTLSKLISRWYMTHRRGKNVYSNGFCSFYAYMC